MNKHEIEIKKTGRYFTLGPEDSEEIWIVLHGYGQLANYFLKRFEPINDGNRLIVAPEGLHRFYWQGFSGRVVASWMTKEDRLSDIKDYVNYLDQVIDSVATDDTKKIVLLAFSQGTATACRWAVQGNSKIDKLILWAGAFPDDIDYFEEAEKLNNLDIELVIGDQDEYYSEEVIQNHVEQLKSKGLKFELNRFKGDHNVYPEPLKELL